MFSSPCLAPQHLEYKKILNISAISQVDGALCFQWSLFFVV